MFHPAVRLVGTALKKPFSFQTAYPHRHIGLGQPAQGNDVGGGIAVWIVGQKKEDIQFCLGQPRRFSGRQQQLMIQPSCTFLIR